MNKTILMNFSPQKIETIKVLKKVIQNFTKTYVPKMQ